MLPTLVSATVLGSLALLAAFTVTTVVAALKMGGRRQESLDEQDALSTSRFTIPVSVILPIVGDQSDEGTIQDLLALDYPEFEVIVVTERMTDEAVEVLKQQWQLEPKEFFYRQTLTTSPIRRIYRSARDKRLMVVEKTPRGRADALNCGVNLARFRYIAAIAPGVTFDSGALLRAMTAALRDPGQVVATSSHVDRVGADFQRLESARSLMASRMAWRWLRCGLASDEPVVIWRRDAILQAAGFTPSVANAALDMMFRLQARQGHANAGRVVRTSEVFGFIAARPIAAMARAAAERQQTALQMVWTHRHLLGTGELGARTIPYFIATEVVMPLLEAWAVIGTALGAAAGWFAWSDFVLVLLAVSLGQALLSNAALLLRGSAPGAPDGDELTRLLLVAPSEFIVQGPTLACARLAGWLAFLKARFMPERSVQAG